MVVHDDEVADKAEFGVHLAVEFCPVGIDDATVGKHLQQSDYASLDQVNAGGFECQS